MNLSEFKTRLNQIENLEFELPNGQLVPVHFHVTEVGQINKHFIDCGGTIRTEKTVNFQLWEAADYDHRLAPQKLKAIIALSEDKLGLEDAEIEVEYQAETIGKYGLDFKNKRFQLTTKSTNCLASDKCGIPADKLKIPLTEIAGEKATCCTPGGGCC